MATTAESGSRILEPVMASLIEDSFNERWFKDRNFRRLDKHYLDHVRRSGVSPFKAKIAQFIKDNSTPLEKYYEEIEDFKQLFSKHISGAITTNYDMFLETIAPEYKVYIGQEELIFSSIQGVSEIYKIHGCITAPDRIVINQNDYSDFNKNSAYLVAKLMTIFVEYPIIFIGYSISDPNIQTILQSIVDCLSEKNLNQLQNRFFCRSFTTTRYTKNIASHHSIHKHRKRS